MLSRLRGRAATVYRRMRRAIYRSLHPGRHQRARDQLRAMARPRSIVVLCYGNICRSPYLEAALRRLLPDVAVSSAGFVGPGRPVPPHGITVSTSRGLDLTTHRSRTITPAMLSSADLIVVMDGRQASSVVRGYAISRERIVIAGDLDPVVGDSRWIEDPWRGPLESFEFSYSRLERAAAVLAESLAPSH